MSSARQSKSDEPTRRRTTLLSANRSAAALIFSLGFAIGCVPSGMLHGQMNSRDGARLVVQSTQDVASGTPTHLSTSSPISLSLHQAVKLALEQNPQLIAARLEALESKQTTKIARSAFLPKASLSLGEQSIRLNTATVIGQEVAPYSIGPYSNVQLVSNFDVPIISVAAWRSYQAQKQRERASFFESANAQETIASIVVNQYLALQRAKATERAVQSRIELAGALLHLADDQVTQGTGTHTDALRANVELQVEKQNLVAAQADTRGFSYGLAQVLGLAPDQYIETTEELNAYDEAVPDEQHSLAEALATRPDLSALRSLAGAAHYDEIATSSQRWPEIHFNGYWAQSGRSPDSALPVYSYQAEMRVPIFTGGRIGAESKRAKLSTAQSEETITDRRNAITQQVRTALSSLQAARDELQLSTEALRLSTREVIESRDRFQAGVTNNIEVITAQNSLAQATDSQIGAMYRLQKAKADLSQARGRIAEEYGD